ncbi:hypothetical protein, partial [Klebsiella pneumoniae]|uniref:hypothetical protein n=1 Tax=Klebsiella pneumoniae TaxID=573 RepID=UPI003B5C8ACC
MSASCFVGLMECYAKAGIELPDEVTRYPGREKDFYSVYAEIDVNCIGLLSVLAGNDNHQVLDEILPEHMLELGAFLNISRFHHLSLEDLLHLETTDKDIDRSKFLYQIAKASGLEPDKLRQQAASLKRQCEGKTLVLVSAFGRLPAVDADMSPERVDIDPDDFDDLISTILHASQFYSVLA